MKKVLSLALILFMLLAAVPACAGAASAPLYEPSEGSPAEKIVVISDIHLGVDDAYAEIVQNRPLLVDFIHRVAATPDIAELVIAGDFLDEWFQPFSAPAHADSAAFYRMVAQNNAEVIGALEELIAVYGKKVVYIPGNHDMTLDYDTVASMIPGISQARDAEGLGVYRAGLRNEIVIEHGHRYNVFVAPDSISNSALSNGKSILPPGYFYTRIGVSSYMEGKPDIRKDYPAVQDPGQADASRYGAYLYYKMWMLSLTAYPVSEGFDDKVIDAGFAGFTEPFSIRDVLPAVNADGKLSARLFPDFQDNWPAIQANNFVTVPISFNDAVLQSASPSSVDTQAETQYFDVDPTVEVVVFGHTHVPVLAQIAENKVYANSGTWIDHNTLGPTATFVLIGMGEQADTVELCQYNADGSVTVLVGQ
jgi:UDP-2,3-diacylglucosamine pyrophosphatase LpxH